MPQITPLEQDVKRLWGRIRTIANDNGQSPADRQKAALEEAEKFIVHAQEMGDEARTLSGCIIKADTVAGNNSELFIRTDRKFPRCISHIAPERSVRKSGEVHISDSMGIAIALRDFFDCRYQRSHTSGESKFLTNMFSEVARNVYLQNALIPILAEHHLNPFSQLKMAIVGIDTDLFSQFLVIQRLFNTCETFHTNKKLDAKNAAQMADRFDYVITAGVINDNLRSNAPAVVRDTATITKPGGKIIHMCLHSPPPAWLAEPGSIQRQAKEARLHSVDLKKCDNEQHIKTAIGGQRNKHATHAAWSQILIFKKQGEQLISQPPPDLETGACRGR